MDGPEDSRNLRDLIQTAQRIQAEVARIKDDLSSKTASGESGGGLVKCVVSGTGEVLELTIDPTFPSLGSSQSAENKEMLEDLIVGAVNVALARAKDLAQDEISRVTGGLPMPPGMFGA